MQYLSNYHSNMKTNRLIPSILILAWMLLFPSLRAGAGEKINFDRGWKFMLNSDRPENAAPGLDDSAWQEVTLPHDWSISLPFDDSKSGSIANLPGGTGWYRKSFSIPASDRGKTIKILFDGIYSRSDVYINGHHLGFRPYGFIYIEYDLSPYLNYGGENIIAVRAHNPDDQEHIARWYTGSGINRHAFLCKYDPLHFDTYGMSYSEFKLSPGKADFEIVSSITNDNVALRKKYELVVEILDADGQIVFKDRKKYGHYVNTSFKNDLGGGDTVSFCLVTECSVENPHLWSTEDPYLYTARQSLYAGGRLIDRAEENLGIRTAEFTSDKGFILNGKPLKIKGFCIHQDDAGLGAALPLRSMERKLEIFREFGVNAIRCSHNPPAPEFLDLCDRMGFLVIDEAFDKWKSGYYAEYFDEWWRDDLLDMLVRDNCHPSVILWSIGNEVQEAWDESDEGVRRAEMLRDFVHDFDPTRPVNIACQNNHQGKFSKVADVAGYNYLETRMLSDHKSDPSRIFLVTEELPYYCGAEGNIRSYDTTNPWEIIEANDFIAGGFIWSGCDYIGEAVWPSRGWPNGLFDICMVEKPRAGYLRSKWNDEPFVNIMVRDNSLDLDHGRDLWQWPASESIWNFPKSYEGLVIELNTISNCEQVQLYFNGKLMGEKTVDDFPNSTVVWNLPYHPGTLEARGINGGEVVATYTLRTAGEPVSVKASPDRNVLKADGQDLSYIQIELLDENGTLTRQASRHIKGRIEGEGELVCLISSDLRRTTPFTSKEDDSYFGRAMAIVRTTDKAGKITLKLEVEGFGEPVLVELESLAPEKARKNRK